MPLERPHVGREEAETDCAAAVAVLDAVDQRRQFLTPCGCRSRTGPADAGRRGPGRAAQLRPKVLIGRNPLPELIEAGEQARLFALPESLKMRQAAARVA